jgi:hypothetical protein
MDGKSGKLAWTFTLYDGDIQAIDPWEAAEGQGRTWKYALWGSYRDRKSVRRLRRLFPKTLQGLAEERGWSLALGLQLRDRDGFPRAETEHAEGERGKVAAEEVEAVPELLGMEVLDTKKLNRAGWRLSVPESALGPNPDAYAYVRTRGGKSGLPLSYAPHLLLGISGGTFSNRAFIVPNPRICLAAGPDDENRLRALTVLFSSSVFRYLMFFQSTSWGVSISQLRLAAARQLPVPALDADQIVELAQLQRRLEAAEQASDRAGSDDRLSESGALMVSEGLESPHGPQQRMIDAAVERVLRIPDATSALAREFWEVRFQFNKGKSGGRAALPPTVEQLHRYAERLRSELDTYAKHHHRVMLTREESVIGCTVEITRALEPIVITIHDAQPDATVRSVLWSTLRQQRSQWVYVQRSLRLFDGPAVYILKAPRLVDWTETQALLDADDIIAEVVQRGVA